MFSYLSDIFTSPFIIPLVAIVAGIAVPVLSSAWTQVEKHKQECELKRSMIERGMSVDDIERVLAATTPDTARRGRDFMHVNAHRQAVHS